MDNGTTDNRIEDDRVIGRRVEHDTRATEADERAYRAANPLPDPGDPSPGHSENSGGDTDGDSEPTRSE